MKKLALSPSDWELIRNYLLGGGALGAGAGLATALANELQEDARGDDSVLDKDTLKVTLRGAPQEKVAAAEGSSFMRAPLAVVGGLAAAGGSYALVRALHQAIKKRELKQQLEEAQNAYLDVVDREGQVAAKNAAAGPRKGLGWGEGVSAIPLTMALMLGLSSAAVTNQLLRKSFPNRQSAVRMNPKRVVVRTDDDADGEPESEEIIPVDKLASAGLVETVCGFDPANSDVADLVAAAAIGRLPEMQKIAHEYGIQTLLSTVRGAGHFPVSALHTKLAAHVLVNDAQIGPAIEHLAAAEYLDAAPTFYKLATNLRSTLQRGLIAFNRETMAEMHKSATVPALESILQITDQVKSAATSAPVQVTLQQLLQHIIQQRHVGLSDVPGLDTLQTVASEDAMGAAA